MLIVKRFEGMDSFRAFRNRIRTEAKLHDLRPWKVRDTVRRKERQALQRRRGVCHGHVRVGLGRVQRPSSPAEIGSQRHNHRKKYVRDRRKHCRRSLLQRCLLLEHGWALVSFGHNNSIILSSLTIPPSIPENWTWTCLNIGGPVFPGRVRHTANVFSADKILVFGGLGESGRHVDSFNDTWILDLSKRRRRGGEEIATIRSDSFLF